MKVNKIDVSDKSNILGALVGAIDRESNRGLLWQPILMELLNDVVLADDVALLAQRRSDMQSKLDDLANRSSAAGLTTNPK